MNREAVYERLFIMGHRVGCHQRWDRSFSWKGKQFPLCARCTGVLLSYLTSIPVYFIFGGNWAISICAMAIMLADWLIQFVKIKESTNLRRLFTGICGGYGIMTAQIMLVKQCLSVICSWH